MASGTGLSEESQEDGIDSFAVDCSRSAPCDYDHARELRLFYHHAPADSCNNWSFPAKHYGWQPNVYAIHFRNWFRD